MTHNRVLIINGQSINKENATGITMQSLFDTWPSEKLMELNMSPNVDKTWQKRIKCICVDDCFPLCKMMIQKKNLIPSRTAVSSHEPSKADLVMRRIRRIFINIADCSPMIISKNVITSVEEFNPDIIYTLGASVAVMKLCVWFAKHCNVPIVLHVMDDWPHFSQGYEGISEAIYKKQLKEQLRKCYEHTYRALAISPQMANSYTKETGVSHIPLMNSIDVESMYSVRPSDSEPYIFTYAGGLHLERWKALKDVAESIESASNITGKKAILRVYTVPDAIESIKQEFSKYYVEFHAYVPHDEIKHVYEVADALVHIEISNPLLQGYFRFSISTKIPEYLASNRPVLFYGPSDIGLYEYLKENECSFLASNKVELLHQVINIITGVEDKKIITNALEVARENHDLKHSVITFVNVINKSCELHDAKQNG